MRNCSCSCGCSCVGFHSYFSCFAAAAAFGWNLEFGMVVRLCGCMVVCAFPHASEVVGLVLFLGRVHEVGWIHDCKYMML